MLQAGLRSMQNDWKGIVLPVVLVMAGLILVGGDLLGALSLDRIQNYWPVAVIVVGLADLVAEPERTPAHGEEHARQL
jgi:hypothetical protein